MTTSILLALLLPACGNGGSVVLDDPNLDEEIEEEEEEEEEEELEPIEYSVEIAGYNENLGGDYCTGAFTLILEDGELSGEGVCTSESSWVSDTEIWIQAQVDEDTPDGSGGIFYDAGWGDPIEAEGALEGDISEDALDLEFTVEVDFGGGWSDTYEYTLQAN